MDEVKISAILKNTGNIEKQLKRDFFLYLFDNGVNFSIESESPAGGAEVDILAVLPELGPLPIEVKVFDGKKRDIAYISGGLSQACEYARTFNSSEAYYIVYNVAKNTRIVLPGVSNESQIIEVPFPPLTINSIIINLCNTYSASQAKNLKTVTIPLP